MAFREVKDIEELKTLVGQEVAVSDWIEITQERINQFADVTDDHQWIHVDVERCRRESPFGGTIAHGFLTLSLLPTLDASMFRLRQEFKMQINSGLNRLRFMAPVRSGSRIRVRKKLLSVTEIRGSWKVVWQFVTDIEGSDKPACVGEVVYRYLNDVGTEGGD